MLKVNLLNILSEPAPNKCQQLNVLLESSNIKDLYTYIEYIINFIFSNNQFINTLNVYDLTCSSDSSINLKNFKTPNIYQSNWPLKLVNRSQHGIDYDSIFNFLNTSSIFWLSLFKLDSYGAVFRIPSNCFPQFIRTRIENSTSYLSTKLDSFNTLSVSPLEYFFIYFLMFVHETKTQSRKVYNEQTNCIEIDSVYGDLLNDYLNFFLPVDKKNLEFPSFSIHTYQFNPSILTEPRQHKHTEYPSLFKRSLKKSALAQLETDLKKSESIESTNDIKKIDTFLRLINEILVYPFTNQTDSITTPIKRCKNDLILLSPIKYNETSLQLANLETIFTLSMIVKHSHLFSNAFQAEYYFKKDQDDDSSKNLNLSTTSSTSSSSLAELRNLLFKIYWRKSFYKFFFYNLEHWSFDTNIKWLIELWLIYLDQLKSYEFIKENYFLISDIYEVVIKRYSLGDLTNFDNLQLIVKMVSLFVQSKELIKKCDLKISQVKSQSIEMNKQEYQQVMRHNSEFRFVMNLFQEFERPINTFNGLIGIKSMKLIGSFYESLTNAKSLLNEKLVKKDSKKSRFEWVKSLFVEESDVQFRQMSDEEIVNSIRKIDECLELINNFYQNRLDETIEIEQQVPTEDYETTDDQKLKLTPKGRYRIIHGLAKPKVTTVYDPEQTPIGDFENKFLVYFFRFVSELLNENFGEFTDHVYQRTDVIGTVSRKFLYKSKKDSKTKLNLRYLASYKFIFYFLVYLLMLNLFTGYSIYILIPFVLVSLFVYVVMVS